MIEALRREWAKVRTIDPCGDEYKNLCALLDALSQDQLKIVVAADIKFVSKLALNRIKDTTK